MNNNEGQYISPSGNVIEGVVYAVKKTAGPYQEYSGSSTNDIGVLPIDIDLNSVLNVFNNSVAIEMPDLECIGIGFGSNPDYDPWCLSDLSEANVNDQEFSDPNLPIVDVDEWDVDTTASDLFELTTSVEECNGTNVYNVVIHDIAGSVVGTGISTDTLDANTTEVLRPGLYSFTFQFEDGNILTLIKEIEAPLSLAYELKDQVQINVFPNPILNRNIYNLEITSSVKTNFIHEVYNNQGNIIYSSSIQVNEDINKRIQVRIGNEFTPGTYLNFFKFEDGSTKGILMQKI